MPPLRPSLLRRLIAISFLTSFTIVTLQFLFVENGKQVTAFSVRDAVQASVNVTKQNEYHANEIPNGFLGGVSAGFLINEDLNDKPGIISDNLRIVRDTIELLDMDVLAFLNESNDRAAYLDIYRGQLLDQAAQVTDIRSRNKIVSDNDKTEVRNLRDHVKATQKSYAEALQEQWPDVAQDAFDTLQRLKSQLTSLEETQRAYSKFDALYRDALKTMEKRYLFLTANREAILKGIRVVDIKDPQIKLVFSQREWERLRQ